MVQGADAPNRAALFVDGNNWYHAIREAKIDNRFRLDYAKISEKLSAPRKWIATRYYIGRVQQTQDPSSYADQRKFVDQLEKTDSRITVHFGRIEPRIKENAAAKELRRYIHALDKKIDRTLFRELLEITKRHEEVLVYVEKAVDVNLAVDMVTMAANDSYDTAYLLTADGDFTSAVDFVRSKGKKVFAACPGHGAELAKVVNTFIHLPSGWFSDCYT